MVGSESICQTDPLPDSDRRGGRTSHVAATELMNRAGRGDWYSMDEIVWPTFFHSAATCLHVPTRLTREPTRHEGRKPRTSERHVVGCCEVLAGALIRFPNAPSLLRRERRTHGHRFCMHGRLRGRPSALGALQRRVAQTPDKTRDYCRSHARTHAPQR